MIAWKIIAINNDNYDPEYLKIIMKTDATLGAAEINKTVVQVSFKHDITTFKTVERPLAML